MECAICYNKQSDLTSRDTFVTLPCEATQHLNQRHTLCFQCFIVNHSTSDGKCPVCRDNYMEYVRETHDVLYTCTYVEFADNRSSPLPPPEERLIIIEQDDEVPIVNTVNQEWLQANVIRDIDTDEIGETFEEFARYVMENCEQDIQENRCIVCGIDMGEENPRQLCGKTYCPEMYDE